MTAYIPQITVTGSAGKGSLGYCMDEIKLTLFLLYMLVDSL